MTSLRRKDYLYLVRIRKDRRIRTPLVPDHLALFEKLLPVLLDADVLDTKQFLAFGFEMKDLERQYAPEAAELALRLRQWKTFEEMEKGTLEVLGWWFGWSWWPEPHQVPRARKAARGVWNAWRAHRGLPPEEFPEEPALLPRGRVIPLSVE